MRESESRGGREGEIGRKKVARYVEERIGL